jgi:hypothetical protein
MLLQSQNASDNFYYNTYILMSVYLTFYILTVCLCVCMYDQNIVIGLILVPVLLYYCKEYEKFVHGK